jgi:hypothetical protein
MKEVGVGGYFTCFHRFLLQKIMKRSSEHSVCKGGKKEFLAKWYSVPGEKVSNSGPLFFSICYDYQWGWHCQGSHSSHTFIKCTCCSPGADWLASANLRILSNRSNMRSRGDVIDRQKAGQYLSPLIPP